MSIDSRDATLAITGSAAAHRTTHASGLGAVERELAALHHALLRNREEGRAVRLSVLTLVVACATAEDADVAVRVVDHIAAAHPARAIIAVADPRRPDGIEADISLSCSIAGGRDQVCAEVVRIQVGGEAALHLASVFGPLLLADVPVLLWVAGAARLDQALTPESAAVIERVVLDVAAFPDPPATLRELDAAAARLGASLRVSDLAWARLRPWRELVARAVDVPVRRPFLRDVERITVTSPPRPGGGPAAEALLLGGWLGSRLGAPAAVCLEIGASDAGAGVQGVVLECRDGDRALRVEVRLHPGELRTSVEIDAEGVAGHSVPHTEPDLADLVGAALQEQGPDAVFAAAVHAAVATARVVTP